MMFLNRAKRLAKKVAIPALMVAAGGLALGVAADAEARGCRGPGFGYGYGYGYGPRAVVVSRPVVVAPGYGVGYGGVGYYGYGRQAAFYGAGYRGFQSPRGGISIGFGF